MWLICDAMRCNAMIYGWRSEKEKKRWTRGWTKRSEMSLEAMLEKGGIRVIRQRGERVQDGWVGRRMRWRNRVVGDVKEARRVRGATEAAYV